MSLMKKIIRNKFRNDALDRDGYKCVMCDYSMPKNATNIDEHFDVHHIMSRDIMPNGGYVKENGITLCHKCHIKAEYFYVHGDNYYDFTPEVLYSKINSSFELAIECSMKL